MPGYVNKEFLPVPVLKPKVLGNWEQLRVNMPERSYKRFPFEQSFKIVNSCGDYFEKAYTDYTKDLGEQFKKHLDEHLIKFNVIYFNLEIC